MAGNEKTDGNKIPILEEVLNKTESIFCSICQKTGHHTYVKKEGNDHYYRCDGCGTERPYSEIKEGEILFYKLGLSKP